MSKLLENGLEAQIINGLTRDNTKVVTVLFKSPTTFWFEIYSLIHITRDVISLKTKNSDVLN